MIDLKSLRESRNLTQKEVASRLNVSRTLVYKFEKGSVVPSDDTIGRLALIYDMPVDYIKSVVQKGIISDEHYDQFDDIIDSYLIDFHTEIDGINLLGIEMDDFYRFKLHSLRFDFFRRIIKMCIFTILGLYIVIFCAFMVLWLLNAPPESTNGWIDVSDDIIEISDEDV